jgi:hypothetical protein
MGYFFLCIFFCFSSLFSQQTPVDTSHYEIGKLDAKQEVSHHIQNQIEWITSAITHREQKQIYDDYYYYLLGYNDYLSNVFSILHETN